MGSVVHYERIGDSVLQVIAYARAGGGTSFDAALKLPDGQQISCSDTGEDLFQSLAAAVAVGRLWATRTRELTIP